MHARRLFEQGSSPSPSPPQVRAPHIQWHEAKKGMKRDLRWESTKLLDHEEREQMFQTHVLELANKKRLQFRKLLEETTQVMLHSYSIARSLSLFSLVLAPFRLP